MTLDKIKVKNFQSIEDGEVSIGSFTVFMGPSSSGKSAFLRASQALIRNTFVPTQVRMGCKVAEVTAEMDGREITAIRGKSQSTYRMDGQEYTKAGRTVPDDIERVFSMPEIGGVEASFATQFDKPFLIADPGSVASKVLGTLTNVSMLHEGLRESNRRSLELRAKLKVRNQDKEDKVKELEAYKDLPDKLNVLQSLLDDSSKLQEEATLRTRLQSEVLNVEARVQDFQSVRSVIPPQVLPLIEAGEVNTEKLTRVQDLTNRIRGKQAELPTWEYNRVLSIPALSPSDSTLETLSAAVANTAKLFELLQGLPDLSVVDLNQVPENIPQSLLSALDKIASLIPLFKDAVSSYSESVAKCEDLQAQYDSIFEDLRVCPLCNSMIGECVD